MNDSRKENAAPRKSHAALWTILILLVLGVGSAFVIYKFGEWRLERAQAEAERVLQERTRELVEARAVAMARTAAVLSRQSLEMGQTEFLQESLDDLVREPGILSITVFDPDRIAVVATDRKVLGAVVTTPEVNQASLVQTSTLLEGTVYFPVMASTRRLGTLRLQYDPSATELFGEADLAAPAGN